MYYKQDLVANVLDLVASLTMCMLVSQASPVCMLREVIWRTRLYLAFIVVTSAGWAPIRSGCSSDLCHMINHPVIIADAMQAKDGTVAVN